VNTQIRPLESGDYPAFFHYLNAQLEENGKNGNPLFQPISREVICFPPEKEATFVAGLSKSQGQSGWRSAWVICNEEGEIMGHVDLRGHNDSAIKHRALLGMGVSRSFRRQGLATKLLEFACGWAGKNKPLEWIDIEVLAVNQPAVALYLENGFEKNCEIPDLYRIDDAPESVIRLAKNIG
jgi:ribosomal protein S18 acetylase RimI-like enzyme